MSIELRIDRLSKTYANGVKALQNVSLTIPAGMFGLLGPNGAGKSTLMRTIATLQEPDDGQHPTSGDHRRAAAEGRACARRSATCRRSSACTRTSRAEQLLDHFAVLEGPHRPHGAPLVSSRRCCSRRTSGTCASRSSAASPAACASASASPVALLGNPQLIIVDEPTAGLDPAERVRFLNLLSEHRREQRRHPLHAHRRGRRRALHAAWRSSTRADPAGSGAAPRGRDDARARVGTGRGEGRAAGNRA